MGSGNFSAPGKWNSSSSESSAAWPASSPSAVGSKDCTGSSTGGTSIGFWVSAGRNVNGMAAGFKVDLEGCGEGEGGVSRLGSVSAPGNVNSSSDSSTLSLKTGGCPVESFQAPCEASISTVALFRVVTSLSVAPGEPLENPALHKTVRGGRYLDPEYSGHTLGSSQVMP